MDAFKRMWQSGHEGQHIEELISGVFSDFAPYAGAEHQRLSLVRQYGTCAVTGLTVEESGDLIFNVGHAAAGSTVFTTTGLLQVDANVKVPLPPPTRRSPAPPVEEAAPAAPQPQQPPSFHSTPSSAKRFVSTLRGAQLFFGIPTVSRPAPDSTSSSADATVDPSDVDKSFGQLEVEGNVPALLTARSALGLRAGPVAARVSRTPTVVSAAADATMGSGENSPTEPSGTLQDTTTDPDRTVTRRDAVVYTLDASVCLPLAELMTLETPREAKERSGNDSGSGGTEPSTFSPFSSLALTMGVQHPFATLLDVAGDTLVGVALQNDRGISEAYQRHAVDRDVDSGVKVGSPSQHASRQRFPSPPDIAFRFLVVQTLMSAASATSGSAEGGRGGADGSAFFGGGGGSATRTNTTSRMQSSLAASHLDNSATGFDTTRNRGGDGGASRPWHALPTLVGGHVSFQQQLVRLSVASIFHDGEVDVEAAAVVDVTQWVPKTPTLLKLGWNNTGRLALGITSLFYNALSLTLGVHATPGEAVRFGLEVKM